MSGGVASLTTGYTLASLWDAIRGTLVASASPRLRVTPLRRAATPSGVDRLMGEDPVPGGVASLTNGYTLASLRDVTGCPPVASASPGLRASA